MTDPKSAQWHYHTAITGQQGPVDFTVLQGLVRLDRLAPGDLVWTDGMAEWKPASQVVGLHKSVPPPLPASVAQSPAPGAGILPHTMRIDMPGQMNRPADVAAAAVTTPPPADSIDYSPFARQPRDFNLPASSNYLVRHWRGELPLPISFWLNGTLFYALLKVLAFAAGQSLSYSTPAGVLWAVVIGIPLVSIVFQVWSLVGIWRSAERYKATGGEVVWAILAQVVVGIVGVLIVISLFMLMSRFSPAHY